ncbi:hypothetical protein [Thalassobaculum litoreum]|uniref:hypothetical protein n=1 Tax=Thalassobaculum litoreum TaxID=420996 RepID=UPI001113DE20|nr:hypothetical protein [Thalassobaculum litoreum]
MNRPDEKLITLMDLTVDRIDTTEDVFHQLSRLSLYIKNKKLMCKIDTGNVLIDDIQEDIEFYYNETMTAILAGENGKNFKKHYDQLSREGRTHYWWRGQQPTDVNISYFIPWP